LPVLGKKNFSTPLSYELNFIIEIFSEKRLIINSLYK